MATGARFASTPTHSAPSCPAPPATPTLRCATVALRGRSLPTPYGKLQTLTCVDSATLHHKGTGTRTMPTDQIEAEWLAGLRDTLALIIERMGEFSVHRNEGGNGMSFATQRDGRRLHVILELLPQSPR